MIKHLNWKLVCTVVLVALTTIIYSQPQLSAQANLEQRFQVDDSVDQLELIAGAARRLKFDYDIPELVVENPEILQATPVSPNEVLITGLKPGISTITVSDADKNLQMINVEVKVDTRKLEMAFRNYFPDSQIKVHPLQTGVILAGHVARADQVANIMQVASDFFPSNVVNQLQVNGNQNIAIKVKIYEVSRTKLRRLGIDWSYISPDFSLVSSVSQIIQAFDLNNGATAGENTLAFGVVDQGGRAFNSFINTLERHNIAKLLDQPVLVAQNGRPAEFLSGGEFPIQTVAALGQPPQIEYKPFGTKLDMVPIVHGNGELTLEVRAEVSEVAEDLASDNGTPGFRVRRVNTGVKMKAGHTLALAGDYREEHIASKTGIPGLMHSPVFGPLFRTVEDEVNETELVFLITPRFISDVDPSMTPQLGPGQMTTPPSSRQLMVDGYLEVPRCADDCPVPPVSQPRINTNQGFGSNMNNGGGPIQISYPGLGAPQQGSFGNTQQRQPMTQNPIQPVAFNRQVQNAASNQRPTLLQRIGVSIPKPSSPRSQAGGGFMWPESNGQ